VVTFAEKVTDIDAAFTVVRERENWTSHVRATIV
jgi:hypothetical protein